MEQGYQLTGDGDEKVTDNWYGGGTDRHYTAGGGGDILAVLDFGVVTSSSKSPVDVDRQGPKWWNNQQRPQSTDVQTDFGVRIQ